MIELKNNVTKISYMDKDSSYSIITYLDIEELVTPEDISEYVKKVIDENDILRQDIIKRQNIFYLSENKEINHEDYYTIDYTAVEQFNTHIDAILEKEYTGDLKWCFSFYIDKEKLKTRMFFKIHHSYADGYQIINILLSGFTKYKKLGYTTPKFRRDCSFINSLYYFIIGTLSLIINTIKFFIDVTIKHFFSIKETGYKRNGFSYIICKKIRLNDIKNTRFTVNDFLYSLVIETDKLYHQKKRILTVGSAINVSGKKERNNIYPLIFKSSNARDTYNILKETHSIFNDLKYSLFVPISQLIMSLCFEYINIEILSNMYDVISKDINYVYSNMIGPSCEKFKYKISDIHFLTTPKDDEITYNIISYDNNINSICSYKKGVIEDPERFEKCLYEAYNNLINTISTRD